MSERVCRCGHLESAHDAGECWTHPDNDDHPDPACPCGWWEPVDPPGVPMTSYPSNGMTTKANTGDER